jgi:TolB-like protein
MPDIFLSYTREDQATAQRFAEAFEALGFSVWWDVTLRSGEAYDTVTEEALRVAKAVIVLWSKKSVTSRWVRAEATLADRNRTLAPARIEPCELPIMFELTQTADLCHWNGAAKDPAWSAFVKDVRRFVEADAATPSQRPSPNVAPPPALSGRPSLAVLPFINRSGREEDDVFADDMVEDLTGALSVSQWTKVVAASATAAYRKGARDLPQIGRALGARYLLEGNLRRAGEDLRVTVQLVEAESGAILWTQRFGRALADIAALQDDLVTEAAGHLRERVRRIEMEHALKSPGNVSPWESAMRSNAYAAHGTRSGWAAVVAEHRRTLDIDPDDAETWASLTAGQGQLWRLQGGGDRELAQEIVANARRARELDPNNPNVLMAIASALTCLGRLQEALPLAERSVAINPNIEGGRLTLGQILVRLGRSEEAHAELDAADRLAPNSPWLYHAATWRSIAYLQTERPDEALKAAEQAVRLLPGLDTLIQSLVCYAQANRWDDARGTLRRLTDAEPETSWAQIEHIVRDYYRGSATTDAFVALARKVWDETSSEVNSP